MHVVMWEPDFGGDEYTKAVQVEGTLQELLPSAQTHSSGVKKYLRYVEIQIGILHYSGWMHDVVDFQVVHWLMPLHRHTAYTTANASDCADRGTSSALQTRTLGK